MYPDPITPRAHPDLLSRVEYDPFRVMPGDLPPHPRVFTTAAQIARARQRVTEGVAVDRHCLGRLIESCRLDEPLPPVVPTDGPPDWGGPLLPSLQAAFRNALAWRVTDDARHRQRALEGMRQAAHVAVRTQWNGNEHNEADAAGRAFDLLAPDGMEAADDNLLREMLGALVEAMDLAEHHACNNHNAMQMAGRLSLAAALGRPSLIHDAFYGCQRRGRWRYGLIHLLRHDFLADGMQWEGTAGYHMLVLGKVCECFTIMEHLGVDLWHRSWPASMQDEGFDEHRGWGHKGVKTLTSAFDALLYQMLPGGDYSLLHDQGLGNLRGTAAHLPTAFLKAYEVYGDPRYAWALRHINHGRPVTGDGPVPVWLDGEAGAVEWVRCEARNVPDGEHPLLADRAFSMVGRHVSGCSLFPVEGSAVLRIDPAHERAPAVRLHWGPHWAGHRAPAALHLDIHAFGRRFATAPHHFGIGYVDPRHLTWKRSTIAHNTVTVDEQPMFPFDFPTDSLWECDRWRDTISDGVLELFQPEAEFKAVRASNDNVYAGVKLDRTVVLTRSEVLDVYRVTAERPRRLDWALHCHGDFGEAAADGEAIDLGQERGYRHLSEARVHPQRSGWVAVPVTLGGHGVRGAVWLDGAPDARLIVAREPEVDDIRPWGDLEPPAPRTTLIVRATAASALFVAVWRFGAAPRVEPAVVQAAGGDVVIELGRDGAVERWTLPMRGQVSFRQG